MAVILQPLNSHLLKTLLQPPAVVITSTPACRMQISPFASSVQHMALPCPSSSPAGLPLHLASRAISATTISGHHNPARSLHQSTAWQQQTEWSSIDQLAMEVALSAAGEAASHDEVPIGAAVLCNRTGKVLSTGRNRQQEQGPGRHAEIEAMERACSALGLKRLDGCSLFVTLEPCLMCWGAASLFHVERLVAGCLSPKFGAVSSGALAPSFAYNHSFRLQHGLLAERSAALLRSFFEGKRRKGKHEKQEEGLCGTAREVGSHVDEVTAGETAEQTDMATQCCNNGREERGAHSKEEHRGRDCY